MRTRNLVIIFIIFLFIAISSGLVVFFIKEKGQPVLNERDQIINLDNQPAVEKKSDESIKDKIASETAGEEKSLEAKPALQAEKIAPLQAAAGPAEKIPAVMLINGVEFRTALKPGSSAYDLMSALKEEKKLDFKSINYSGLGFFIEEINGIRNNPAGENWLYYVNGRPGRVGSANYFIKANDIIEWKYEKKSF